MKQNIQRIKDFNGDWDRLEKELNEANKTILTASESPYTYNGKEIKSSKDLVDATLDLYPEIKSKYIIPIDENLVTSVAYKELFKGISKDAFIIIIIILPGIRERIIIFPPSPNRIIM